MHLRVAITGASGFVGSSLSNDLYRSGIDVVPLVRDKSDISRLSRDVRKSVVNIDITRKQSLPSVFKKISPSHIIHLASYGVDRKQSDPLETLKINLEGTLNLLEATKALSLRGFINTGSVYEYGSLPGKMMEAESGEPRNFYDATKISTTAISTAYAKIFQLPTVTIRPFTIYGPNESPNRFVSAVYYRIKSGQPPLVSRSALRDFVYIDDVVEAYKMALKKEWNGEVINIGGGAPKKIKDAVELILKITKSKTRPKFTDKFDHVEDSKCWADITKAKELLGWKPQTSLESGLQKTINWLDKNS